MKKFFTLLCALALTLPMLAGVVSFLPVDFLEQGVSGTGGAVSATKNGVTVTCDKGFGATDALRCYKNSVVAITSTSTIQKLNFEFSGSGYTNGGMATEIEVNAMSWTETMSNSQTRFARIDVTIDAYVETPELDTISVSQALARIADENGNKGECYVKGKVLSIITNNVETYGNISYWMADIDNPSDSLQAYRMKGADNTSYADALDVEFVVGDEILVYTAGLTLYHNTNTGADIPELNSGYYVRTLNGAEIVTLDWAVGNAYREDGKWALEIEKVAAQPDNVVRLVFESDKETSLAGYHVLAEGSSVKYEGSEAAISGSVVLTFKEVNNNGLNVYAVQMTVVADEVAYRLNNEIEFYAQDENGDEIVLVGDRPFVPAEGDTITCAQAREYALSLGSGEASTMTVTVKGFVTDMFSNGVTFWMDDQRGEAKTLQAYSCTMPLGVNVVDGTEVYVTGKLKNYNGTPEVDHGTVKVISGAETVTVVAATVAEAVAVAQALEANKVSAETYAITGYITAIVTEYSAQYGNISFWMSDNVNDNGQVFQAYRAQCDAAIVDKLVAGAKVKVTDKIKHFHQDATEGDDPKPERTIFETNGGGVVELLSGAGVEDIFTNAPAVKFIENGQLIIIRNGVRYNVQGQIAE